MQVTTKMIKQLPPAAHKKLQEVIKQLKLENKVASMGLELEEAWLNSDLTEPNDLLKYLKTFSDELMESWMVSKSVGSTRNDFADLIKPEVNSL